MFLTHADLFELTGKIQSAAQRRALDRMGIEFKPRKDGTPAVLTSHVEKVMDGFKKNKVESKHIEPDWEKVD